MSPGWEKIQTQTLRCAFYQTHIPLTPSLVGTVCTSDQSTPDGRVPLNALGFLELLFAELGPHPGGSDPQQAELFSLGTGITIPPLVTLPVQLSIKPGCSPAGTWRGSSLFALAFPVQSFPLKRLLV